MGRKASDVRRMGRGFKGRSVSSGGLGVSPGFIGCLWAVKVHCEAHWRAHTHSWTAVLAPDKRLNTDYCESRQSRDTQGTGALLPGPSLCISP